MSPTQVEVGPDGTVYALCLGNIEADLPGYDYGDSYLQLVRSDDGGATFSAPVHAAPEATEGVKTAMEMASLFTAYVVWAQPTSDEHEERGPVELAVVTAR